MPCLRQHLIAETCVLEPARGVRARKRPIGHVGSDVHDCWPTDRSARLRRQFTDEFRAGVIRTVLDDGNALASHLNPAETAVRECVRRALG